jgi:hypothetical protein
MLFNFMKKPYLASTAEDHKSIGSTPPEELLKNPGKTLGELWDTEQIKEFLDKQKYDIKFGENHLKSHKDTAVEELIADKKVSLKDSIDYLKRIGKLPTGYNNESSC